MHPEAVLSGERSRSGCLRGSRWAFSRTDVIGSVDTETCKVANVQCRGASKWRRQLRFAIRASLPDNVSRPGITFPE